VSESGLQIVRMTAFVAAVGLASVLERVRPHAGQGGSVRTNVALWAIGALLVGVVCGGCACVVGRWAAARRIGVLNVLSMPLWVGVPVTVVGLDLVSYCWHRANHTVPLLWRFHSVHHSDPRFTASTGLRFHPGELLLSLPLRLLAIVALGAAPVAIVAFEACFAVANFVEHADLDLPLAFERAIGRVVVTPALHRFHHTRVPIDRDRNFGTVFTLWDRLLGTYRASTSAVRVDVGLDAASDSLDLVAALLLPLRRSTAR
jgi:sterol desaturase/sphingolipid hydroxylase (fatty acid hydroxylase superfamily)